MPYRKSSRRSSDSQTGSRRSSSRDRNIRKIIFKALAVIAVLSVLGVSGWYVYRTVRQQHAMASAREFAEKKQYNEAALAIRRALMINPKDLAANKLMAHMADAAGDRQLPMWRRTIAELEPGVTDHYIAWANAAIRFQDIKGAEQALGLIDEAGRNTGAYHEVAAKLAMLTGRSQEVSGHIAEAAKLDPHNDSYQLQLAAINLGSPIPEVRNAAFSAAEQLTEGSKVRRPALHTLIQAAITGGEFQRALGYTRDMMNGPGGVFEDRMLYLTILKKLNRVELWWFLAQLHADLPANNEDIVTLLSWMNNNGFPKLTLQWSEGLSSGRSTRMPVCVAVAEAHALLGNWSELKTLLKIEKWDELEFQRDALIARVMREEGDEAGSKSHWAAAVTGAGERPVAQAALMRFANAWNWNREYTDLLWRIAAGRTNQSVALKALVEKFSGEDNLQDLLRAFQRMLELNPVDIETKNNVAYASLLLNTDIDRAQLLSREAYSVAPGNAGYAATLALALHYKNKTDQAIKIMTSLEPRELEVPATALCYGILLAASGNADEARKFLHIAETGRLLKNERALLAKALESLPKQP